MDKKKQQYIMLGALLLVFVVVLVGSLMPKKKKKAAAADADAEARKGPAAVSIGAVLRKKAPDIVKATPKEIAAQKIRAEQDWGLDPFYHLAKTDQYIGSRLVLKGVTLGPDRKGYAFINTEIVAVDDIIAGYRVIEVEKTKVLLGKESEQFYLVLPEE